MSVGIWVEKVTEVPDITLQDLLATADHATLVLSAERRIVAVNDNARRLVSPGDPHLEGRPLSDVCSGRLAHFCRLVTSAMESGEAVTECDVALGMAACKLSVKRGERYWVVRIRDVTVELSNLYRLREAEAEKDEMRAMMMTALNGLSVGIVVMDTDNRPVYVNRFARRFVGDLMERGTPGDFASAVGLFEADGVTPLTRQRRVIPRALRGETVRDEKIVLKNEITERSLNIDSNAAPFYDRDGKIVGAVGWYYLRGELAEGTKPAEFTDTANVIELMARDV